MAADPKAAPATSGGATPGAGDAREDAERDTEGGRSAEARARRRQQILLAATEVFAERGYHDAGVSDIILRAGIARGTFYHYFTSKHELFAAMLDEAMRELRGRIAPVAVGPGAPAPRVQLHANVTRVLGYVLGNRPLCQILLNLGLRPDDEIAERVRSFNEHASQMVEASLRRGIELGLVRRCDTGIVAAAILGAVRGVAARVTEEIGAAEVAGIADELIDFALGGVLLGK